MFHSFLVEHLEYQLSFMTQLTRLEVGIQASFRSGLVYPDYFSPFYVNTVRNMHYKQEQIKQQEKAGS